MPTHTPCAKPLFVIVAPALATLSLALCTGGCAHASTPPSAPSASDDDPCRAVSTAAFPKAGGVTRVERLTRSRYVGRSEIQQTNGVAIHLNGDGQTSAEDLRRAVACQSTAMTEAAEDSENPLRVRGAQPMVIEDGTGFVVEIRGTSVPTAREIYARGTRLQSL